jgi:hypothetical protein
MYAALATLGPLGGGCLLPPDGSLAPIAVNHAPELRPDSVRPRDGVLTVGTDCGLFRLSVDVIDRDGDTLVIRVIADNRTSQVKFVDELLRPATGGPTTVNVRVVPGADFVATDLTTAPHTVTIAVTDAAGFRVPSTDVTARNLAEIVEDPDEDGLIDHAVVEQVWEIQFRGGAECPQ